jgi:hypothetical protein
VGFGDDEDAADALGTEPVEGFAQDGYARLAGGGKHDVPDGSEIIKKFVVAVIEVQKEMFP